jgi:serine/threonine protein kinase
MGMVWHAHDVLLDRDVAVKELILPFGLDSAGTQIAFRRVLREARSAARLSHPGIVTVHDVVEEDGRPWIVMELVRAWSLEQAIRQNGPLPPVQAAEIGIRVLDALRHAHAHGILHRDVKPGNVLLTQDRVVLTDFGIAALEGEVSITQTGLLMGSPAYIPPERLQGRPITQAADLWSFGATLYAAVEGRPPYEGPDAVAVLGAVLTQEPARPERAGPLQPVIEGLLRKNPADRISAVQAAQMLEQVLAAHGSARPPQPQPETPDPTPLDALPPLDPPSGPMPSRIIETPSGPVKVPYDPSSDPANTYRPEALRKAEAASATEARMNSTGPHPISSSSGPHSISSSTGPHPVSPATGPHPVSSSTGPHPISTGPHRMPTQPAGPGGSRSSTGPHPVPNPVTPPHARTPRPADPAGLEDVPTGGRDRRATILLAAAAVAVVALMSAVVLVLMPSDPAELTEGGGGEETAEVAAPEATVVPSVVPSASPQQSEDDRAVDGEVPEGYRLRTANGVSVAVPEGWRLSATNQVATFTGERNSGLRIQIRKTTPAPADGGIAELSKAESEATFNEYLQVRLQRVSFKGWKASEWEYTYTELNQVPTHVVTRHVTIDADTAYLITFTAPDAEWEQHRRTLAVLWATFKPAR